MEVEHDFVVVDEFDALAIEVKVPHKSAETPSSKSSAQGPLRTDVPSKTTSPPVTRPKSPVPVPRSAKPIFEGWPSAGKFPAKEHAKKVAKELGVQSGIIYLPGGEEQLYEYSDMGPTFRQRRHFYYLSGAEYPDCAVTYDIARDCLILWIPYTDPKTALWFGTTPSIDDYKAVTAVDDVRLKMGLERFLSRALNPGNTLFVLEPDQTPNLATAKGTIQIDTVKLRPAIEEARVIKTDYEVTMIRRANIISSVAHKAIMSRLKRLSNEREIEAIFRGFCTSQGAKHQAYHVIAGAGPNAACLHYDGNDQQLEEKQVVLIDAGCEWNCYASDITRTVPIDGTFRPEAQAIYNIVERMQEECLERLKPGVAYYSLHAHAALVAAEELLKLGILHNGTPDEIVRQGTVAAFFPHGLGHHIGLEVHDVNGSERLLVGSAAASGVGAGVFGFGKTVPRCRTGFPSKREWMSPEMLGLMFADSFGARTRLRSRAELKKNMVVTVEPGIYFNKSYIRSYFLDNPAHARLINAKVLDKYWDVGGVRIEDCILVTDTGYENLTTAPKGDEMLKLVNGS
ncbi:putative Xaa-Pro aminopeptidase [Naviculisporaceae sp. PSN 640]